MKVADADGIVPAPAQQSMNKALVGMNIEETVYIQFPGGAEQEKFVRGHLDVSKLLQMMCCPSCCLYVPWQSKNRSMEYYRELGCCKCPYAVAVDGKNVGKVHDVGCCDNGCCFVCCPFLTCSGHVKLMGMDGADGTEKFTFAKELFPCWPCIEKLSICCAPLGVCCLSMLGCCHYCQGHEFYTVSQPVYKGPWSRGSGQDPERIGEFVMSYRFNPVSCCCAVPTPLKFYYKPVNMTGAQLMNDELSVLSLVLSIYRGLPVPCKLCSSASFQTPTGVWCLDCGLNTRTEWKSVEEVMKESE